MVFLIGLARAGHLQLYDLYEKEDDHLNIFKNRKGPALVSVVFFQLAISII